MAQWGTRLVRARRRPARPGQHAVDEGRRLGLVHAAHDGPGLARLADWPRALPPPWDCGLGPASSSAPRILGPRARFDHRRLKGQRMKWTEESLASLQAIVTRLSALAS